MRKYVRIIAVCAALVIFNSGCKAKTQQNQNGDSVAAKPASTTKIQVALLLDTSNSMDGLIDQAKSRLWNIINTLTTLKYKGETPNIEIALYEYGNDGLSEDSGYIRQVTPLTTDLDLISEKLFALKTNGGSEYCGAVIQKATKQLSWSKDSTSMKLIYIAGNESFDQGTISYKETVRDAIKQGIYVNTIFCGGHAEGISELWESGSVIGQGKYFNIDENRKIAYVATPYDDKIAACNERMNNTYIAYGSLGMSKKTNQMTQDKNAADMSASVVTERVISKSKVAYKNSNWDMVDQVKDNKKAIDEMKTSDLPDELKGKSKDEIKAIVAQKAKDRTAIQKEIGVLAAEREAYIKQHRNDNPSGGDDLGEAISKSIVAFAEMKGYSK